MSGKLLQSPWVDRVLMVLMLIGIGGVALATITGDSNISNQRGYSYVDTAVTASDVVHNDGCYTGTNWVRIACDAQGGVLAGPKGYPTWATGQQSVGASAQVPTAGPTAGRQSIEIFNEDSQVNLFCGSITPALVTNGVKIEPGTGREFKTQDNVYCISAGAALTVDFAEYIQ